jgi:2,5-furandicarboxylate decarboxylase 1
MQKNLRSFIDLIAAHNHLLTVEKEVDPKYEIPAVMKGAEKTGNAILFKNVGKTGFSIINNLLGDRKMLALLFETSPERVVVEWVKRVKSPVEPRIVETGAVKEVIKKGKDVDLEALPIVTHCSNDAGPFITAGMVIAKDPETGVRNVSINRMQLKGRDKLGIRMMPPQHLGIIHEKSEKLGKNLEVAVAIGNHPFEILSAATSVDFGFDEFTLSGALHGEPLNLVKCETVDLEVPAFAEIVIEGEVLAGVREPEGPFGDFMQFYVPVMNNHVMKVKAITHRRDPIYQTIQASSLEDTHILGLSREGIVYEAVSKVADVKAISMVPTILNCMISIRKHSESEPKDVEAAAFGAYSWLKYCVVVDHDVNVFDVGDVWWAMATRSRPDTALLLMKEALGFPRDPFHIHQSKLGIDATAPLNQWDEFERKRVPGEEAIRLEAFVSSF